MKKTIIRFIVTCSFNEHVTMTLCYLSEIKPPLSSHMSLLKNLAYSVWRENFNSFFNLQKKNIFWISEKKNVKLEKKHVLIKKIVPFLGFRKPYWIEICTNRNHINGGPPFYPNYWLIWKKNLQPSLPAPIRFPCTVYTVQLFQLTQFLHNAMFFRNQNVY